MDQPENKENLTRQFPEVRFEIDEEKDVKKIYSFFERGDVVKGGANFKQRILQAHPELADLDQLALDERLEKIKSYVRAFYERKKEVLEEASGKTSTDWKNYSTQFFEETERIFKGHKWPKGRYIGYLTISPPCPRYLDFKTFQFPYNSTETAIRVTSHEMLHFIFYDYDYVRQKYLPEMSNTLEKDMNEQLKDKFVMPLWDISETFNIVVLSGDEWGSGKQEDSPYRELVSASDDFKKTWEESGKNIDKLLTSLEER